LERVEQAGEPLGKDERRGASAGEQTALDAAEAQIRMLKSDIRSRERELEEALSEVSSLRLQIESIKENLETEKLVFYETAKRDAAESKEAAAKQGHEEGYARGYADGLTKSEADVRSEYEGRFSGALLMLSGINDALLQSREKLVTGHAPQLIRLWEMILQRLLQAKVELEPDAVKRVLEYILKRVSDREKIIIYLNPEDISAIEAGKENLMDSIRGVKFFELMADDHVDRGSCLIETNLGIYDARWRTQLEQISSEVESLILESLVKDGGDGGNGKSQ
jgi:flagellar assembly protein FliH